MAYKHKAVTGSIADAVSVAFSELDSLRDECESWRDGMTGTNLENSQKYQTLDEAVSSLENVSEPTVPDVIDGIVVSWSESVNTNKRRGLSRAQRLSDACGALQVVADEVNGILQDDEQLKKLAAGAEEDSVEDELESFVSEIEDAIGEVEGVEFPGMFG